MGGILWVKSAISQNSVIKKFHPCIVKIIIFMIQVECFRSNENTSEHITNAYDSFKNFEYPTMKVYSFSRFQNLM